jgi:hypothetical protein
MSDFQSDLEVCCNLGHITQIKGTAHILNDSVVLKRRTHILHHFLTFSEACF